MSQTKPSGILFRLFSPRITAILLAVFATFIPSDGHANSRHEVFRFDKQKLQFGRIGEYDVIRYEGLDMSRETAAPQVPVKLVHIALPPGKDIADVRVTNLVSEEIDGAFDLFPVQPPQILSQPAARLVSADPVIYSSSEPYPRDIARVVGHGHSAGFNLGAIVVSPVQYIPGEGKIVFHGVVEVEISYKPSGRRPLRFRSNEYTESVYRRSLDEMVEDPLRLSRSPGISPQRVSSLPDEEHRYVIVTADDMVADFELLADWKTRKGLSAEIVTTTWIAANYTGVDLQEQIRNFIVDAYQNWGTVWVLLGGDTNVIPARSAYAMDCEMGYPGANDIPCDLYYSDLDGDWNANGNSTYGEITDDVDMYPDVFVGRAPVENMSEAGVFVLKVLKYEIYAFTHALDMLFLAEILWNPPFTDSGIGKNYIDSLYVPDRYDPITKLYQALGNENYTTAMNALNDGQNIVNHDGHAWITSMSVGAGYLLPADMDALHNDERFSILYSIGCWPAAIDYDCIAEHFVTNPDGGGVAFIGNSRYGWGSPGNPLYGYSDRFDQQFFKRLFSDGVFHAGQTLASAKSGYVAFSQQENVYRWCEYEINLLGDPEMPIWTDMPSPMNVTYPTVLPVGSVICPVTVTRQSDGSPVEGALVCLSKDGEVYETGVTGHDGQLELGIAPVTPTEGLEIVVTAQNLIPFTTTIALVSSDPCVQIASYTTNGSDGGHVAPGEGVSMDVCFKNVGSEAAANVTAILRSDDAMITVTDSTESLGTILAGDSIVVPGAFSFDVAPGMANGNVVHLESQIFDEGDGEWTDLVSVTCATPVLHCVYHLLLDDAFGDGDGVAEAGETVDLNLYTENSGLCEGTGIVVALSTDSPHIQFTNDELDYGSMSPGDRKGSYTGIVIDPACPEPSFPRIDVQLETGSGHQFVDSFTIAVGEHGLADDMEDGEGVWTHSGTLDLWHLSSNRSHSGGWSWYCGVEGLFEYGINMDNVLVTAPFVVGPDAELTFWCWYDCATYGTDGVYAEISDGTEWLTLDFLGSGGALGALTVGNGWLPYRHDLPNYPPGTPVTLRFRFVSDGNQDLGEGVYIDDVYVGREESDVAVAIDPRIPGPRTTELFQNYPNPFNPSTTIEFVLEKTSVARIDVFDVRGVRIRTLANEMIPAGRNKVIWYGRNDKGEDVATGIYFYRLVVGEFVQTKKMIFIK